MKHVISINQFSDKKLINQLFERAKTFSEMPNADYPKPLLHMTIASIFYEPSTRTRLSFETAIQNLGANLITVENADTSSAKKGESLEDTIKTINVYAEAIVLRHPEVGAADRAAAVSNVPIINAGDGAGEHPTQALLDLYTIFRAKGTIDGLKICLVGDLLNSRTMHSLATALSLYEVEFYLVSPNNIRMPKMFKELMQKSGSKIAELDSWDTILKDIDVLYCNRIQKERFKRVEDYMAVKDSFVLSMKQVNQMKNDAVIMNPLPRINEIELDVDDDPRAIYFQQVRNGLYMRMALLEMLFDN